MTDDVKKPSELLDKTAPMPVPRGQTRDPTTDEGDPPSFVEDTDPSQRAKPTSSPTDDTVVRTGKAEARVSSAPLEVPLRFPAARANVAASAGAPASFDDEVAQRKVSAARPARGLTAAFPRPPTRPPEVTPDAETTPARGTGPMKTSMAGEPATVEAPKSSSGVFAEESKGVGPLGVDPLARGGTAPIMSADDIESIPTAPIPMLTGLHARDLRYDEPSLPKARQVEMQPSAASDTSDTSDTSANDPATIGDGIEFIGAAAPVAADVPDEHTVEHTPTFMPAATQLVSRQASQSASSAAASAPREVSAANASAPTKRRFALPLAALIGAGAGVVVVVTVIVGLRVMRARATAPPPSAVAIVAPVESVKPVEVAPVATAKPIETVKPVEVAPAETAETVETVEVAPPAVVPPVVTPARDGFGPFVNRAGIEAPGIGPALGRGLRALLGDDAFAEGGKWPSFSVRGEIRRARVRDKVASVDCALTVVDARGPRAQLSATGTAPVEGSRDAALRNAADRCGRSLDVDLKTALDHARR